jgi:hypothetical protein
MLLFFMYPKCFGRDHTSGILFKYSIEMLLDLMCIKSLDRVQTYRVLLLSLFTTIFIYFRSKYLIYSILINSMK